MTNGYGKCRMLVTLTSVISVVIKVWLEWIKLGLGRRHREITKSQKAVQKEMGFSALAEWTDQQICSQNTYKKNCIVETIISGLWKPTKSNNKSRSIYSRNIAKTPELRQCPWSLLVTSPLNHPLKAQLQLCYPENATPGGENDRLAEH